MGSAMLSGWLETGTLEPAEVLVNDKDFSRAESVAREMGVRTAVSNADAAAEARIVVLAVKPHDSPSVLDEIARDMVAGRTLLSIVAGLSIESIRRRVGTEASVVRAMPNMGARVGASVSGYSLDPGNGEFDASKAVRLLEAVGEAVEVEERWIDLVTAVSGSGPAYFFLMAEAMERASVEMGLDSEIARKLVTETLWGAASVLRETGREAAELRRAVSSPGGTTLAALEVFEEASFLETVCSAVSAAHKRAGELST